MQQYHAQQYRGFTLIELSIVLVIIGLIAAGVTSGMSILRDSTIKRALTDAENYKGMVQLFKNNYKSLPGDFRRAGGLWGDDCNGATGGTDTCSGNGNGLIQHGSEDSIASTSESLRLWQHLSNADIFPYQLTGLPACGTPDNICAFAGENIPESSINNAGIYIYSDPNTRNTALIMGSTDGTTWNNLPIISPLEAYEIDTKIDDGVNDTGNFSGIGSSNGSGGWTLSFSNSTTNCYNATLSSTYNTTTDDRTCGAVFVLGQN